MASLTRYAVPHQAGSRWVLPRTRATVPAPRVFYVSAAGNDSNDGRTTSTPWLTIGKVNATTLAAGDQVYFRGGDTFTDNLLYLTVSGSASSPIRVGSYGTGRATLSPSGNNAIYAYNCAGYEIRDLICTAAGTPGGAGVQFYSDGAGGRRDYILIDNVTATGYQNGISIGSGTTTAGYSNVTVSNCSLSSNRDNGLIVFGPTYNVGSPTYAVQGLTLTAVDAYSNAGNSGNTTTASGFGINLGSVDTGTVTGCRTYSNGASNGCTTIGPVGLMVYDSTGVTIDSCLSYSNRNGSGSADGEGIDLDINTISCKVQYSLAYDNDGAGILLFGSSSNNVHTGATVRYNLCWGNGRDTGAGTYWGEVKLAGNVANADIYGNTLVARDTGSTQPSALNIDSTPSGVKVRNNILYGHTGTSATATTAWTTGQVLMQGNDYYRAVGTSIKWGATTYSSLASWRATVTGQEQVSGSNVGLTTDPLLAAPTTSPGVTTIAGLLTYTGLQLGAGSPAAAAGLDLLTTFSLDPGSRDYYGNTLTVPLSIGAHENDAVGVSGSGTLAVTSTITGAGAVAASGAGTLGVTATVSGTGLVAVNGSGTRPTTATISGAGSTGVAGAGTRSVTATITGAGSTGVSGSGTLAVTDTIAGAGSTGLAGSGTSAVTDTITGAGSTGVSGSGTLPGTATITGSGGAGASGTLTATAAITGAGSAAYTGSGTRPVTATITGAAGAEGAGTLTGAATIDGAGLVATSTGGTLTATDSISGAGSTGITGAGTVAVTAALTGTGTVTSGLAGAGTSTTTATISGAGNLATGAGGSLAETATVAGSGNVATSSVGTVTTTVTITGAGLVATSTNGNLTVTATITGSGQVGLVATGTLTTSAGITGTGTIGFTRGGALVAVLTITGAGTVAVGGTTDTVTVWAGPFTYPPRMTTAAHPPAMTITAHPPTMIIGRH